MRVVLRWALPLFLITAIGAVPALDVTFHEYDVPTPRSRPHDPAVAPDGALWYTGQLANKLGRLDPQTGSIKEFQLSTPESGPHGLTADAQGNIWFTANFKGYIGKLDPATGNVQEFPVPDPRGHDPHTPVFDQHGILWFTVQQGNLVGRLDPKTGKIEVKESPTPNSVPYGIAIDSRGTPYYCESRRKRREQGRRGRHSSLRVSTGARPVRSSGCYNGCLPSRWA
jgi:virginiamycin B lyase